MDFSKYLEWIKLSPRYLLPIAIFTGFVLFAPSEWLDIFGLTDVVERYRPYFGLLFLLATVLLISSSVMAGYDWVKRWREETRMMKEMRQSLHCLSEPEKEVLRGYIDNGTKTCYLSIQDGVVGSLRAHGIIYRGSTVGKMDRWAYNIQPWAWEYLNANPELLTKT